MKFTADHLNGIIMTSATDRNMRRQNKTVFFFCFLFVLFEFIYLFVCAANVCSLGRFQWRSRNGNGSFVAFDVHRGNDGITMSFYVIEMLIILEQNPLWKSNQEINTEIKILLASPMINRYIIRHSVRSYCAAHCPRFGAISFLRNGEFANDIYAKIIQKVLRVKVAWMESARM